MRGYIRTVRQTIRYTVSHCFALSQIVGRFNVENKCIVLKNIFDSLLNTCIDVDSLLIITE